MSDGITWTCPKHGPGQDAQCMAGTEGAWCIADDPGRPHGVCGRQCTDARLAGTGELLRELRSVKGITARNQASGGAELPVLPHAKRDEKPEFPAQAETKEEVMPKAICEQCESEFVPARAAKRCPACCAAVVSWKWSGWRKAYGLEGAREKAKGGNPKPLPGAWKKGAPQKPEKAPPAPPDPAPPEKSTEPSREEQAPASTPERSLSLVERIERLEAIDRDAIAELRQAVTELGARIDLVETRIFGERVSA